MGRLIAAADIGSNTAHLLVAHVTPNGLKRLVNESDWLSLGEVVTRRGTIPPEDRKNLFATLKRFKEILVTYKVEEHYIFATEAMRRADNHDLILREAAEKFQLNIDIISPQREAELSYIAAQVDCPGPDPMLLVEAGGGSVQVAFCEGGAIEREISLPVGTGALTAASGLTYPATETQENRIRDLLCDALTKLNDFPTPARIVSAGGVARGLWRALHPDGDRNLHAQELAFLAWDCRRLSPETIVSRYDVKVNRARTLLPGSLIFGQILAHFGLPEMTVSQYGVREGAVLEMAQKGGEKWLSTN